MKTTFQYTDEKRGQIERKEFEAKTGLHWTFYTNGAGMHFSPTVQGIDPDEACGNALREYLTRDYRSFTALAETSHMTLKDVLSGAVYLVKTQQAVGTATRGSSFGGIRALHPWEKG